MMTVTELIAAARAKRITPADIDQLHEQVLDAERRFEKQAAQRAVTQNTLRETYDL